MISNHFYRDGMRYDVIRYGIDTSPRPLGYRVIEVESPDGLRTYGWVSPSGVSQVGYTSLESCRQGAWRDHNCAVRLGVPT